MNGEDETRLDIAQRHVREGLERLERQRTLISDLIRDSHHNVVPAARRFLADMEQYQADLETLLREQQDLEKLLREQQDLEAASRAAEWSKLPGPLG